MQAVSLGSLFGFFFSGQRVQDFKGAQSSDCKRYARFFHAMLDQGVYLPPSAFETCFVSANHGEKEVGHFLRAAGRALAQI
jgi:glutamate-1-semialdehyde 2,1-aminomutase